MKRVVITGAASGIGAETTRQLRAAGHQVVGLDLNPGDDLVACDVRDQASDAAIATAVERLGGLDVLVNNAGIGLPQRATLPPGDDAAAVLDVTLVGPWRVTAAALPALRAARGRVVNIASGLAHVTVPFAPAYCMSKRGVVAYSDALRLELGHEITVTTVYPGYVRRGRPPTRWHGAPPGARWTPSCSGRCGDRRAQVRWTLPLSPGIWCARCGQAARRAPAAAPAPAQGPAAGRAARARAG